MGSRTFAHGPRRATAQDVCALLPLVERYWELEAVAGFVSRRVARELGRLLSDDRLGAAWLALAGDQPVGYLLGVYVFSLEHLGLTAEIDELFVLPTHRGRGVGRALLEAAEREFALAGCTSVTLQVARGNDAARAFYRRLGYVERSGYELLDKAMPRGRSGKR